MRFTRRLYRRTLQRIEARFWEDRNPYTFFDRFAIKDVLKRRIVERAIREGKWF